MLRKSSRLEQEAREARQRVAEIQKKSRGLAAQISNPLKHFGPPRDERTRSAMDRFSRYFSAGQETAAQKRKPTRAELRGERTRAILCAIAAFIVIIWAFGSYFQHCSARHPATPPAAPP